MMRAAAAPRARQGLDIGRGNPPSAWTIVQICRWEEAMRRLKHTIAVVLLLVAAGIVLATALSDHSGDYGRVSLPHAGTVHLPEGKVTVYSRGRGDAIAPAGGRGGLPFAVTPAHGGPPIAMTLANGETSGVAVTRSETIGELGAVAKL